ncbi:hypothetical protein Tco_0006573 [Tanacetum coccineum]
MSSPNHPTSEIEDAFSSNFLDYIPVPRKYVPASSRKTYLALQITHFGEFHSFTNLSLFLMDPYMKVMHAYYAKESPIPSPAIMPPSSMLSSMFNPQEFFLLEELLSPKKQGHNQSFSSTSALPQEFEIGESSLPIVSPTLSLFHDDPYMKVMQAFYAKKSPIPPPTIIPQSSMLNPQEFFLPEELLPPKKQGCGQSSSSTSALPQDFEIG